MTDTGAGDGGKTRQASRGRRGWAAALRLLVVAAVGLTVGDVGASDHHEAAKKEGTLILYTDQNIETVQALIAAFKSRYPGVNVDFYRGTTSQVIQRYETETAAGRHNADVFTATERRGKAMMPKGWLATYRSPELARYPKGLQPEHGGWAVYSVTTTAFAWNTQQVPKGQEPKTWRDLLDPRWQGKVGIQDPLQGGGSASWIATMYGVWGESAWTEYMTKLAAQRPRYDRYFQVQDLLAAGEITVMVAAYPDYVEPSLKAKGAPVEWGTPAPIVRTGLSVQLSAHAPHPSAGKLFIDFLLSEQGQGLLAKNDKLPALQSQWPAAFARLQKAEFVPPADELEQQRFDFFQGKMREFFGKR
jgi:iron(III) transport system substrate-binding protein